jgi:hypothetical protein
MDRHDRPVGDRLALSPPDLLEVQRTLAALGAPRALAPTPPVTPGVCDETLAIRLARFLRLLMRLAP